MACGGGGSTGSPDAAEGADAGPEDGADAAPEEVVLLRDSTFDLEPMDTGNINEACTAQAPWGPDSWGIEAATFSDPLDRTIDTARFLATGRDGYLYGYEGKDRWGFVRFIQGDMWGGTNCGPVPWHTFPPVSTFGKEPWIDLELYRDTNELHTESSSWIMFAVNLWFSSPDFPKEGGDVNGRKPLVMDLVLHHECNTSDGCTYQHGESEHAYHYMTSVGQAPFAEWGIFSIALAPHIENAFSTFDLPQAARETLKLYQVEFVIELKSAEGAASIDDFVLRLE